MPKFTPWGLWFLLVLAASSKHSFGGPDCQGFAEELQRLELRNRTINRMGRPFPELALLPGRPLIEAINDRPPVSGETLVRSHPGLLESYRGAIEYYGRFQSEIAASLPTYTGAARTALEHALNTLVNSPDPRTLTAMQLYEGIFAVAQLRSTQARLAAFSDARPALIRALSRGVLPLPVFQNEPMSQRELLLYQSALVVPFQIPDSPRMADGILRTPLEFLYHDLGHADRSYTARNPSGREIEIPTELSDYPWLNGPEHRQRLARLRIGRYETLRNFLDSMPGIDQADRPNVVPVLFEIFHENFSFYPYSYNTSRQIPADLRILARYLREHSSDIPESTNPSTNNNFAHELVRRAGVPWESARRILLAISRIQ